MKKLKYLMPILGLTGLASAAIPMTSCSYTNSRQIVINSEDATYTISSNLDDELVIVLTSKESSKIIRGVKEVKIGDTVLSTSEYLANNNKVTIKQDILDKYSGTISITPNFVDGTKIVGLSLKAPDKKEYYVGDKLNLEGMVLKTKLLNGSTETITEGYTVTPSLDTPLTEDDKEVTISYAGFTASFEISVTKAPAVLLTLRVDTLPTKVTYFEGETLELAGLVVKGDYDDGTTKTITDYTTTPAEGTELSTSNKKVEIAYGGKTCEFPITVKEEVTTNYVTLEASAETTLTWYNRGVSTSWLQYSFDGAQWNDYVYGTTDPVKFGTAAVGGTTLMIRGNLSTTASTGSNILKVEANTATVVLSGSLMNLAQTTRGKPGTTLTDYQFKELFYYSTGLKTIKEDDTTGKLLPAKTLTRNCYNQMFRKCTNLSNAPELPATTLAPSCYYSMFWGSGITAMPELPASTLDEYCYQFMFDDCDNLVDVQPLKATTLTYCCYDRMFQDCDGLKKAPVISAETLNNYSCYQMFWMCDELSISDTSGTAFFTCPDTGPSSCVDDMFSSTAGPYTEDPVAGKTYYFVTQ